MNVEELTAKDWDELWKLYSETFRDDPNKPWIFRGLRSGNDNLDTTLEREANKYEIPLAELPQLEEALIRQFKRQAHRHLANTPDENDVLAWLALMRHYGAPARLVDWTYSFFVALYFAVEGKTSCAIWALDHNWLRVRSEQLIREHVLDLSLVDPRFKSAEFFKRVFRRTPYDQPFELVYSLNPETLNDRLATQQGLFLAPANIKKSFIDNFTEMQGDDRDVVYKITINLDVPSKKGIIRWLHRMNISRATLFPGLDGFAGSLNMLMAMPDILKGRLPYEAIGP
jgi:hypothetical protein